MDMADFLRGAGRPVCTTSWHVYDTACTDLKTSTDREATLSNFHGVEQRISIALAGFGGIAGAVLLGGCVLGDVTDIDSRALESVCGDGQRDAGEACDDGNGEDGDGCSSACTVESGYACTDADFSLAFTEFWDSGNGNGPQWSLSADGLTVRQSENSQPAIYMTNLPASGARIAFELEVEQDTDDDFIGWVVGFEAGDTTSPDAEFMLFDWKQHYQVLAGGTEGLPGLAMNRVTGAVEPTLRPFWGHSDGVAEEARAINRGSTGWEDARTYTVELEYSFERVRVWVDGGLEFDETGAFPTGKFGFYTMSQPSTRFTLVAPTTGSICGLDPAADPDGDGVPTGDDPDPFDPSICGDADGDGVDDCQDTDGDGVFGEDDLCPDTPAGDIVDDTGCSIAQLCPCDADWRNHGGYVSCVAHAAGDFVAAGLLTEEEKGAVVSAAGRSDCGKQRMPRNP